MSNVRPRIPPMPLLYAQIALLSLLPLTLSVAVAAYFWKGLAKPWLFLIVATAIGYLIYGLLMYLHNPDRGKISGHHDRRRGIALLPAAVRHAHDHLRRDLVAVSLGAGEGPASRRFVRL